MSRAQRSPSRVPSTANNNKDTTTNAALLGALLAFGGASKSNGDLVRSRGNSPNAVTPGSTPGSSLRRRPPASTASSYNFTAPAEIKTSNATATATATTRERADTHRTTPPQLKQKPRRLSEHHYKPQPISPTTSFVGVLEHKPPRSPKPRRNPDAFRKPVGGMDLRDQAQAPSLERGNGGLVQEKAAEQQLPQRQVRSGAGYPSRERKAKDAQVQDQLRSGAEYPPRESEAKDAQVQGRSQPPKSQGLESRARARAQIMSSDEEEYVSASEATTVDQPVATSKPKTADRIKKPPTPPPTRSRQRPNSLSDSAGLTQPIDIARPPGQYNASARSISTHSNPSVSATYHQLYPRQLKTPLTLGEDLANAMVASSLATSRASSPSKPSLSPPSQPHHSHLSPFHSRNNSPKKSSKSSKPSKKVGMRHTLRDPESSSSESETGQHPYGKHKKKRHLRPKHPNKHHEGDRKRWRDAVTERERKRYEGLYASNRGLHLPDSQPNNISNIVVHDLWMRSRLPRSELETIWNLVVAASKPGKPSSLPAQSSPPVQTSSLNKEQFVVGLWLIDQRLKGRKLPIRVSETVWASVKGLQGIKVKKFSG